MPLFQPLQCDAPRQRTPFWLHPYAAAAATALGAIAASVLLKRFTLSAPLRLAAVAVVMVPAAYLVYTMWRWLRGLDEMQRRIQAEALSIAFPAAMLGALAAQFLQRAGFVGSVGMEETWVGMGLLYITALLFTRWRYR